MKQIILIAVFTLLFVSCEKNGMRVVGAGEEFVSGGVVVKANTDFEMQQFFNLVADKEWVLAHEFYYDKNKVGKDFSAGEVGTDVDYFVTNYKFQLSGAVHKYLDERRLFNIEQTPGSPVFNRNFYQEFKCNVDLVARTITMKLPGDDKVLNHLLCWKIMAVDADRIIIDQTSTFEPHVAQGYDATTFGHRLILKTCKFTSQMQNALECKAHWAYCLEYMKLYNPRLWEEYKDNDGLFLYRYY